MSPIKKIEGSPNVLLQLTFTSDVPASRLVILINDVLRGQIRTYLAPKELPREVFLFENEFDMAGFTLRDTSANARITINVGTVLMVTGHQIESADAQQCFDQITAFLADETTNRSSGEIS